MVPPATFSCIADASCAKAGPGSSSERRAEWLRDWLENAAAHSQGVHGGGFRKVVFRFGATGDFETVRRSLVFLQPSEPKVTGDFRGRCVSFASG